MNKALHNKQGFTLLEVLVASTLALLVMGGVMSAFIQYQRSMEKQRLVNDVQGNLRVALSYLTRDISMAGYGLDLEDDELPVWITWVVGFTENPMIEDDLSGGTDSISVAAAFERYSSTTVNAPAGSTTITVEPGTTDKFNTMEKSVIYVGRCELARITAIMDNTLTITTNPDGVAKGLQFDYPAGSPIELVEVRTYSIGTPDTGAGPEPCLERNPNNEDEYYWFQNVITTGIDDFQVSKEDALVTVLLQGRSRDVDTMYTDPIYGDAHRRIAITNKVFMRNI
jgi:prepilin-type N-terminal cleavage/methylation domain-containing protein